MGDAKSEGLKAAAEVVAKVMRQVAGVRTRHTAEAVHIVDAGEEAIVQGGHPGGPWGWEPIQGLMFDDNRRHPLFGNKSHWYHQGDYPITAYTEAYSASTAAEAYIDAALELYLDEAGFPK